ncbi:MAG: hypothetical protein HQL20_05355 [Candidatus Omnitrophica bacterium]|nr:hypothetical protein [Candidatus Omnitrophota bacterium]
MVKAKKAAKKCSVKYCRGKAGAHGVCKAHAAPDAEVETNGVVEPAATEVMALDVTSTLAPSAKPVRRAASRLRKARSSSEALESSAEQAGKVAAAVAVVSEAEPTARSIEHLARKKLQASRPASANEAPHRGFLNAVCFWAGSVLGDTNTFLRLKKAN